ncbi:MAG: hypothetical protein ACR2QQ_06550 [Gammaproteobacteria bacterium]
MSWEAISAVAELLGAIAVVISLVFVGFQVRQNTTAVRSAAAQAVHENFAAWYTAAQSDAELLALSSKGLKDYTSLTATEKSQFIAMFMAFSLHTQDAFQKWHEGSLSPELWRGWEFVSMNFLSTPGGKGFWEERGYLFSDEFQSYVVDDIMTREAHPKARPWGAFAIKE